ncbi:MAG: hypothetical protein SGJ18_00265 [Pseudomonadota bacterium]|nr:hypothetical protein [Pseudomonadota bacterium]
MKSFCFVFALSFLLSCTGLTVKDRPPAVYVLGSIHGAMLDEPNYTLHDFISVLYIYKPTLILTEVRPEYFDAIDGVIHGAVEQSIVYAYAKESGAQVVPVDWHNDEYNLENDQNYEKAKTFKKEIQPLFDHFKRSISSLVESQSPDTQNIIRKRYDIMASHGLTALRKRDAHICENIKRQKEKFSKGPVLIVFGLAHKYYLEDCVRELGIQPLSFEGWYSAEKAQNVMVTKALVENSVQTFNAAKELSGNRLRAGYYKTDVKNLNDVLKELDNWIEKVSRLNP